MKNGEYELVIAPDDFPGKKYRDRYCYEHHLVYWQNTGAVIEAGDCVHHKNGDKRDNRFENLELISRSDHSRGHAIRAKMESLICKCCGVQFELPRRVVRDRISKGQANIFCSRSCIGKYVGRGRKSNRG